MKVAIFVGGHVNNGTWSSVSGEGRWALNLAEVLVNEDSSISIDLFNDEVPTWGVQPPLQRVTLKSISQVSPNITYDVAVYVPWDVRFPQSNRKGWFTCPQTTQLLKANLYIHNQFSWTTGLLEYSCYTQNHILVYPFEESAKTFPVDGDASKTFNYEFLPYPHGWEYQPPDISRSEVVWPSKEVFHPAFQTRSVNIPKQGVEILEILGNPSLKESISKVNLLSGHALDPSWTPLVNQLGITQLVNQLPNPTIYNWITYNEIFNIFTKCRLSVPVAGLAASLTEAVCLGVVPLVYNGSPLESIAKKNNTLLSSIGCTKQEVSELIELYLRDDAAYTNTVNEYQNHMKDHCSNNVYRKFIDIVNKYTRS